MTDATATPPSKRSFLRVLRLIGRPRVLALLLTFASIISVLVTYAAITHSKQPFGPDVDNVLVLIILDMVLLLTLAGVISKRLVRLYFERKRGDVGSRLQTRIVVMFSLIAIIPVITMTLFSTIFFNMGIQSWFGVKVKTAIEGSVEIAKSYLDEHRNIIRSDIRAMARDIDRDAFNIRKNPSNFNTKVSILAGIRKLPEAIVFRYEMPAKHVIARSNISFALELILEDIPHDVIRRANDDELLVLTQENEDRVIALIKLENFINTYLLVGRFVDTEILNHIERTKGAATEYEKLKQNISDLQITFLAFFVIAALLLLLAVVWVGLLFTTNLVKPVRILLEATERVKEGNLNVRVPEGPKGDELATLSHSFNRMISQLDRQRKELISVQRRLAWSDVARRIAHEIKNPLTPIQLASERLKRKYGKKLQEDEQFEKYVDTIIRNVSDIQRMVEEFAAFARIPAPEFASCRLDAVINEVVFSREIASPDITLKAQTEEVNIWADSSQMAQVFTNLIKNAQEALLESDAEAKKITISLKKEIEKKLVEVVVADNGSGFPCELLDHLTEPYVTTKTKGTGLGLAIVKKIVEEHQGTISFTNGEIGAKVCLIFPIKS